MNHTTNTRMFKFITRQSFLVNLLVALALIGIIIFIFFTSLGSLTHHGEAINVPDVTGKTLSEATAFLKEKKFRVAVQDSIYNDTMPPLIVVKQSPEADEQVKVDRTVFLTINRAQAPLIAMPDVRGYSFRSAQLYLESIGLKLGDTTYTPDIARNAVKDQLLNGKSISPGTNVPMGTAISLLLGNGLGNTQLTVPNLVGLTISQAKDYLSGDNISIGVIIAETPVQDTTNAYIVKQNPEAEVLLPDGTKAHNHIRAGQEMDVWISDTPPVRDTTNTDSLPVNP